MSELIDYFKAQYEKQTKHALPWFHELQQDAFQQFLSLGFPTRKTEDWKYTSIEPLKKIRFDGEAQSVQPDKHIVTIYDGCLLLPTHLPENIVVTDVFSALKQYPDILSGQKEQGVFSSLNLALMQSGLFIYVPKGVTLEKPIEVRISHSDNALSHMLRNIYVLDEGAKASVIESYESDVEASYFMNVMTDIHLSENAQFEYYKIINEGDNAVHIGSTGLRQAKNAIATCHSFSFGGALSRSDLHVALQAEGAHCNANGLYVVGKNQHVDHHTTQHHLSPHASSQECYKGIVAGQAKAVFNGNIRVEKDAQKTNASLSNKNMLLSKNASVDTKPQLEIFADDVKCAHGTTVGQLDEKALFYLRSRGITLSEARELLVHAFAGDLLEKVNNDRLKTTLSKQLNDKLRKVA